MTTGTGLSERLRVPDVWTAHYVDTESGAVKREVTLDPLKAADLIDDLVGALEQLHRECLGTPVGGGDGGTYVPGTPSAATLNKARAALAKAKP